MEATPAVRFEGISKRFPGVRALSGVTLEVAAGSCHALCGENGAGKSTLGRVLAGIHAPDEGRVLLHGVAVRFTGPRDATAAGVGMVHQELACCDNLSVAENLCLGSLPSRRGWVSRQALFERATAMLAEIGASLDVERPLGSLTIAQQQQVQIAAAIGSDARIIVFDEPTSSLSEPESERLFELMGRLKARGVTTLYVSHRMPEIFRLCDRVSVLRDGTHIVTRPTRELTPGDLAGLMIGRAAGAAPAAGDATPGDELLGVEGLTGTGFRDVSFSLRAGEIVGLAGLVGAGRTELARALFGIEPATRGGITVAGRPVRIRRAADAIALGIGLVPEDRKRQGLVGSASVIHNVTLPILRRLANWTWLHRAAERTLAAGICDQLGVRSQGLDGAVAGLSGGNQQKVLLARWLAARSRILILDEPTRGVDVGAKAEIHTLVARLASQGTAVLLISSELPELLGLASRILVLRTGQVVGEVARQGASQASLLHLMAGLTP